MMDYMLSDRDRLERVKTQQIDTAAFIDDLIKRNEQLAMELEERTLDLESMQTSCRATQRELKEIQSKFQGIRRNRYAMVLIDGDGMIFRENLIAQGKDGGAEAGRLLLQEVTKGIQSEFPGESIDIHVKVFASLFKLATVLHVAERVKEVKQFKEFSLGFTQCKEHFYFIDVGGGKEMVDSRIRAELTWNLDNYNCVKVILGASHDNGYARTLSSISSEGKGGNVLLLEGTPLACEVARLRIPSIKYPHIFESQKLETPGRDTTKSPGSPAEKPVNSSLSDMGPPPYMLSSNQTSNFTTKVTGTYANVAVANTARDSVISATGTAKPRQLFIGSSLKKPIPTAQHQLALARIKGLHPPPCNDYYLVGTCWKDSCFFSHDHDLGAAEIQAMRNRVGLTRCEFGEGCINESCYRGHECQSVRAGRCVRPNCPFLESEHPAGAI